MDLQWNLSVLLEYLGITGGTTGFVLYLSGAWVPGAFCLSSSRVFGTTLFLLSSSVPGLCSCTLCIPNGQCLCWIATVPQALGHQFSEVQRLGDFETLLPPLCHSIQLQLHLSQGHYTTGQHPGASLLPSSFLNALFLDLIPHPGPLFQHL